MFHLQAGVALQEEELIRRISRDDEFHRSGADVVDAAGGVTRCRTDPGPGGVVQQWRGRLFDHLLMAALQTALTFTEVQHRAMGIGEHLYLNMPGAQNESFEEQGVVTERCRCLPPGNHQRRRQVGRVVDAVHTLAAAACGWFDQDREANITGSGDQVGVGQSGFGYSGYHRNTERRYSGLGCDFVAHGGDGRGRRADEHQSGARQGGGEICVLREESVTGVHCLRPGAHGRLDHSLDIEITLPGGRRPDPDSDVGLIDMARARVGVAVDRH